MGTLTLSQFRDETRVGMLGRRPDDSTADTDRLNLWVNWSYLYVSQPNVHRHEELRLGDSIVLVAGTPQYTLPSATAGTFYAEEAVALVEPVTLRVYRLLPIRLRELLETTTSPTTSLGRPTHYTIRGDTINLDPAPSAQHAGWGLLVYRWARPALLAADGNVTVLPTNWDEVIVQGAVWRGLKATGDLARAELAKVDFDALINNQHDVERTRMEDSTDGVVHIEYDTYEEGLS